MTGYKLYITGDLVHAIETFVENEMPVKLINIGCICANDCSVSFLVKSGNFCCFSVISQKHSDI